MSSIVSRQLSNGMNVVIEPMSTVASAALRWVVPAGAACDDPAREGESTLLSEMILRGAGDLDSRAHSESLDRLGIDRNTSTGSYHLSLSATMVGSRMTDGLPMLLDIVCRPRLPAEALDSVRSLCLQSLAGLDDDPQHLVMLKLREQHRPVPFNRSGYGTADGLAASTAESLRDLWKRRCAPGGSIFAVAGDVDPQRLLDQLEHALSDWTGNPAEPAETQPPARGRVHIDQDAAQVHIGLAADAPREADPDSMLERLAVHILGGATSGRLFTEIRQKRSLCYSVGARYRAGRDRGGIAMYAGTTPERATQTLDLAMAEFQRLRKGVTAAEFHRAVIGMKSRLIMHGESTGARAAALLSDTFRLGRARSLDDVAESIDAITLDALNAYLARRDFGEFTMVTIGRLAVPATA